MDEHFTLRDAGDYEIIEIKKPKFDLFEVPMISKTIETHLAAKQYPSVIIDLTRTGHIDSTGFGFLISIKNGVEKHGNRLVVVCDVGAILHVIEILNMDRFLKVVSTIDEAEQYLVDREQCGDRS